MNDSTVDITSISRPEPVLFTYYFWSSLLAGPFFPFLFIPRYFKYRTLRYDFDEDGISMSWGKLWKQEVSVSYSRIQDIHLSRNLIERWLDLAKIEIQTASGDASAELTIVGLTSFETVRDVLYSKMRGARFGDETSGDAGARSTGDGSTGNDTSVDDLLNDIHQELRQLRETVEGQVE